MKKIFYQWVLARLFKGSHTGFLLGLFVIAQLGFLSHGAYGATSIQPGDLRCESLIDPQGIDAAAPRLSWAMIAAAGSRRGLTQKAYQIQVASSPELLAAERGDVWDSGKIDSSACVNIQYAGMGLASLMECFWRVRVWDEADQISGWSKSGRWSMGLLNAGDWRAQWIGTDAKAGTAFDSKWIWYPEGEPQISAPVATRFFRKVLAIPADRKMVKAVLAFTADNEASFVVNGKYVGNEDNFRELKRVDLTANLHAGNNVLAVTVRNTGNDSNPAGFVAQITIIFDRGDSLVVNTDASWKASKEEAPAWNTIALSDAAWVAAKELGSVGMAPWGDINAGDRTLPARLIRKEFIAGKVIRRATLVSAESLWSARDHDHNAAC